MTAVQDLNDAGQSAVSPAPPDDVVGRRIARRVRAKQDNRPGGADYVHVPGQLSIYEYVEDVPVGSVPSERA